MLDLGTRPELDEEGEEIPDAEMPEPAVHAARRGGRQPAAHVHDPDAELASPRRRTRSSSPASTAPSSRWSCRERASRRASDDLASCRAASPARSIAAVVGVVARRLRRGRPAGHVAAGRRERPEDPEPAVAGVRHRRRRRLLVFAAVGWCDLPLPRPRPADPRADPRQAGAGDRPDDPAGADPHRRGHPDRRHADRAGQDRRHRVLRQRHRPAVVVGGRLPGAGRLRRHRRRRSSPAARW